MDHVQASPPDTAPERLDGDCLTVSILGQSVTVSVFRIEGTDRWHAGASFPHPTGICQEIDLEDESGATAEEAIRLLFPHLFAAFCKRAAEMAA